jgi:S1 RNA binding domain protein
MALEVGNIVEGVVTGITHFGAFVTLPGGQTGLVHISEVADAFVRDVKDYLKENDRVKVKVISLDKNGKIGLSIRQVTHEGPRRRGGHREARHASLSFEDKLARFLKESDERQSDLRRSAEEKRGGRGTNRRNPEMW